MAQPPIRAIPFWEHIYYTPFFKSAQVFLVLRGYTRDEMSVGIGSFFNFVKLCAAPQFLYNLLFWRKFNFGHINIKIGNITAFGIKLILS